MKILGGNRRIIHLVGLNTIPSTSTEAEVVRIRIHQMITRLVIVCALTLWVAGQIVEITKIVEKDLVAVLSRIYLGLAFACLLVIYLRLIGMTQQIDDLFAYLENVVNNRKNSQLAIFKV